MYEPGEKILDIELIDSLAGLESFSAAWVRLYRECPRATPFQSPHWLLPWTRHLFGGGQILGLAMRKQNTLIGFAPLFCWGNQSRSISFLGAGVSDYGDLLFARETEAECAAALWDFLPRLPGWDAIDLRELRHDSALLRSRNAVQCSVCPMLDLGTYPSGMNDKHRVDLRRATKRLAKGGELAFHLATKVDRPKRLEEFFNLYEARWGRMDDSLRRFHDEASARFAEAGSLWLASICVDGSAAAAIYAFQSGATLYCYLSGFAPSMAKLSPGTVLLGWLIDRAIDAGIAQVDFLRDPEPYKYLWGARDRCNCRLCFSREEAIAETLQRDTLAAPLKE